MFNLQKESRLELPKSKHYNQHPSRSLEFARVPLEGQGKITFSPKLPRSDGQFIVSDVFTKTDDFATSCPKNIRSNAPAEHFLNL